MNAYIFCFTVVLLACAVYAAIQFYNKEKPEKFTCWFFLFDKEDYAMKFEVEAKRSEVRVLVETVRNFLNSQKCDNSDNWHYWINNYCSMDFDTVKESNKSSMDFDTVKENNKKYAEYFRERRERFDGCSL